MERMFIKYQVFQLNKVSLRQSYHSALSLVLYKPLFGGVLSVASALHFLHSTLFHC